MPSGLFGQPYIDEMDSYEGVPQAIFESLKLYVTQRVPTGSFLNAVLCNDLFDACGRADPYSAAALPKICELIYNRCPAECFGSQEKVDAWLEARVTIKGD